MLARFAAGELWDCLSLAPAADMLSIGCRGSTEGDEEVTAELLQQVGSPAVRRKETAVGDEGAG